MISADNTETRIFSRSTRIRLEARRVKSRYFAKIGFQFLSIKVKALPTPGVKVYQTFIMA